MASAGAELFDAHGTGLVFRGPGHRIERRIGQPVGAGFPEVKRHPHHTPRNSRARPGFDFDFSTAGTKLGRVLRLLRLKLACGPLRAFRAGGCEVVVSGRQQQLQDRPAGRNIPRRLGFLWLFEGGMGVAFAQAAGSIDKISGHEILVDVV